MDIKDLQDISDEELLAWMHDKEPYFIIKSLSEYKKVKSTIHKRFNEVLFGNDVGVLRFPCIIRLTLYESVYETHKQETPDIPYIIRESFKKSYYYTFYKVELVSDYVIQGIKNDSDVYDIKSIENEDSTLVEEYKKKLTQDINE